MMNSAQIAERAKANQDYAHLVLSTEAIFERLSFDQVLSIVASHETIALSYLSQPQHWEILDGLALSILAEKNEQVASYIFRQPELSELLTGLDLARMGKASPDVALLILKNETLRAKLSNVHIATLGENQSSVANYIADNDAIFKLDPTDLVKLCKHTINLAIKYLDDTNFVKQCDGSMLAFIAEFHQELAMRLLSDVNLDKEMDSAALVILGRNIESVAQFIYNTEKYKGRLGTLGIARMAKHHPKLAMLVLDDVEQLTGFTGSCFEQLAEASEEVAMRIFREHKTSLTLDEMVMIGKHYPSVAHAILTESTGPQLSGKHLVSLGSHPNIALHILQNVHLKAKTKGQNVGFMGARDFTIAMMILNDPELKDSLLQLDLANLCKNFLCVTNLTLFSKTLKNKISSNYYELLQQRMNTVISISTFIQKSLNEQSSVDRELLLSQPSYVYSFPLMAVTSISPATIPAPEADDHFIRQCQSLYI